MGGEAFKVPTITRGRPEEESPDAFQIPSLRSEVPTPTPASADPDAWISNEEYHSSGTPSILPSGPEAGRTAVETGSSFVLGTAGAILGGRVSQPVMGQRVGEAVGAGIGSLASESFHPTAEPLNTAITAFNFTLASGYLASGGAKALRWTMGHPHESGQELIDVLTKYGKAPPAGAVLDGPLAADLQSFGGSAFFFGNRIKNALEGGMDTVSKDIKGYLSTFQRYHNGAKEGYQLADDMLKNAGLTDTRFVNVPGEVLTTLHEPLEVWAKNVDPKRFSPGLKVLMETVRGMQATGLPRPKFIKMSVNEAKSIETLLHNRAREMQIAKVNEISASGGKELGVEIYKLADTVTKHIDEAIDGKIMNYALPVQYRDIMMRSNVLWKQWTQGTEIEEMVLAASKDLTADVPKGQGLTLLNQLDNLVRRENEIGRADSILTKQQKTNIRSYATALQTLEKSGAQGQFKLAGRQGQLVGYSAVAGYFLGGGSAQGAGLGALSSMAFIFTAPPALAFMFTNETANALLLRGLKMKPGTAASFRLVRELTTLLAARGWVPPETVDTLPQPYHGSDTVPTPTPNLPQPASGGIRGQVAPPPRASGPMFNPVSAAPSLPVSTPLRSAAQRFGVGAAQSPTTVDDVFRGFRR